MDKKEIEKLNERLFRKPLIDEMSENELKIRRNLLATSFIHIFILAFDLHVKFSNIIELTGETPPLMTSTALFALNGYNLIHFMWLSLDHIIEWRLRLTSIRVINPADWGDEFGDYPADLKQCTLYYWWYEKAPQLNHFQAALTNAARKLDDVLKFAKEDNKKDLHKAFEEADRQVKNTMSNFSQYVSIIKSPQITQSLERFNNWFFYIQRSQNLRFLAIELGLPIILGLVAIIWQICKWICSS